MEVSARAKLVTVQEYLEFEQASETKHEYYAGRIYAMAGASPQHVDIADNTLTALRNLLQGADCRVSSENLRVKVEEAGLYTYADITVTCGGRRLTNENPPALLNPTMIVEVLSPSTQAYGHGDKFELYQKFESLREYLLLSQDRPHATLHTRQADGRWLRTDADGLKADLHIPALACSMPLSQVYADVELPSLHLEILHGEQADPEVS